MITKLDQTILGKVTTQAEMDEFVNSLKFKSGIVIVKPNWVEAATGAYTDAKASDLFLGSLKNKKIYILESYTFWRHKKFFESETDEFSSKEAQFETGKIHWDFYKQADEWFLHYTGIDKVLAKHNATFVNVTNELWANRQSPILPVPQVIYDLKGADFISFAKLKGDADYGATLSIKNLFGLYPDPTRLAKFHVDHDSKLAGHIITINEIYRKLFNCIYVIEGIFTSKNVDWNNKENCIVLTDQKLICGGSDAVQVDDTVLKAIDRQMTGPLANLLIDFQKQFGGSFQSQKIPTDYQIPFPKL